MSVRNQLTHYELREFFRSLQHLLVLSTQASRSTLLHSFHGPSTVSKELRQEAVFSP